MSSPHDAVKEALKARLLGEKTEEKLEEPKKVPEKILESDEESAIHWKGTSTFKEVFGFAPHKEVNIENFPVHVFEDEYWDQRVKAFIPKLSNFKNYYIQKEICTKLVLAIETGDKILLTGPTGAGKSTLIECICAHLHRPFIRINMTGDVESSSIFGSVGARDGATFWENGPVTEGWLYGAVINIDEWEVTPPEISMGFQRMLEDNGFLFLKEKPGTSEDKLHPPHEHARLIFSGNTVGQGDESGQFAGVNVQNTAFLNRFQTVIILDYLEPNHEIALLKKVVPNLSELTIERMVKYAGLVRQAHKQNNIGLTISPRTLINWGRKIVLFKNIRQALIISYLDMLRESDRKIANEFYTKIWG